VGRGYLNRQELSKARFIELDGERYFCTRDLGRRRPEGAIEFLGRMDQQVKLRGFRVELGEVEAALRRHPLVEDAVAVVRRSPAHDPRLVAYVVPSDETVNAQLLNDWIIGKLPVHAAPWAFVFRPRLPLDDSGRIDRHRLAIELEREIETAREHIAPRNPIEEQVGEIWTSILENGLPSVNDNFFDVGGNSLLAAQLVAKVSTWFRVEIKLSEIHRGLNTVERLAARIEDLLILQAAPEEQLAAMTELDGLTEDQLDRALGQQFSGSTFP
jgi:acyl carrier protein